MTTGPKLPQGYQHVALGDVDSTNTEGFRRAENGQTSPLWLTANRQIIGRGRGERAWTSEPGNLYATLLLHLDVPVATVLQLPFVAGVAVHRAVTSACPELSQDALILKWPNDLLLNDSKVCGILVESRQSRSGPAQSVAIGFGVNVAHHPAETRHPATHLKVHAPTLDTGHLLEHLAQSVAETLSLWSNGAGFSAIRSEWSGRGMAMGREMSVTEGNARVHGTYAGLDVDGALLLNVSGTTRRIVFGDVQFPTQDSDGSQNHE